MSDGRQAPWAFDQSGKQSCLVNTEFARMLAEKMLRDSLYSNHAVSEDRSISEDREQITF